MSIQSRRIHTPSKGLNTLSPIREMSQDFAIRLENMWFDQAGSMNRRPAQVTADLAAPSASTITSVFEHYAISGVSTLFCRCADNNVYSLAGATWGAVTALVGIFTGHVRTALLGNVLLVADGTSNKYYNGVGWATPVGTSPMNAFTVYNGRMYGTGNAAQKGYIYYSNPISGSGATDWTVGAGGGFIDVGGALSEGDSVVGLGEYQGMLVAFCANSIVFYQGTDPENPATFTVAKTIKGIGCFSADSIQGIGNDLMFLSSYGYKSLQEVAVQGDAAAFETSIPINNYVAENIRLGKGTNISSTFAEKLGVYLCTFGQETLVYHTMFKSWGIWNGIQQVLFTSKDGTAYTATNRLHSLTATEVADTIDGGATTFAIPMVWEIPPFRAGLPEAKARWNRIELLYEGAVGDVVTITTWTGLDPSTSTTNTLTLNPTIPSGSNTSMLWTGVASANFRNAWGTATTGPSWSGGLNGILAGSELLPVVGRDELFSVRVENASKTRFKITALEVYFNIGGIRR